MTDERPSMFVLRSPDEAPPPQKTSEDTENVPSDSRPEPASGNSSSDKLYHTIKQAVADGIVEGLTALKPLIQEMITEVTQNSRVEGFNEAEEEPEIPYRSRYHKLRLVVHLLVPLILMIVISLFFVGASKQPIAVAILVIFVWAISVVSYVLVHKRSSKIEGKRANAARRSLKAVWIIGLIVALLLFVGVLSFIHESAVLTFGYMGISLVAMYFAAREYYKWSAFWIYRSGSQLIADRPASNIFFLKPFHEVVMLQKVDNTELQTRWLDAKLGFDRVMINVPGKKDKYWNTLTFIVDGAQLLRAVNQGAEQAR